MVSAKITFNARVVQGSVPSPLLFSHFINTLSLCLSEIQSLRDVIQKFEEWSGMPVNTLKTKQMTVDGVRGNRTIVEDVTYNGETLLIVPESESVRYMGFWATPNGNM